MWPPPAPGAGDGDGDGDGPPPAPGAGTVLAASGQVPATGLLLKAIGDEASCIMRFLGSAFGFMFSLISSSHLENATPSIVPTSMLHIANTWVCFPCWLDGAVHTILITPTATPRTTVKGPRDRKLTVTGEGG
jgi:hypothetical protein